MKRTSLIVFNLLAAVALIWTWYGPRYTFNEVQAYVDGRVLEGRSRPREVALRRINWVKGLENAIPIAKKSGRLVFAMIGDGSLCTGRL